MVNDIVVAITGASGSAYAIRLLEVLLNAGRTVHLVLSNSGAQVIQHELGRTVNLASFEPGQLSERLAQPFDGRLLLHRNDDFMVGIASGSFRTDGMVICPCSMGTLASVAHGLSTNLIQRAADVHLKERRKLVIVPRETPLGPIQLANMKTLADAGAVVLPAMPGFYHQPQSIDDLVDFVVSRICDQLNVEHKARRWADDGS